MISDTPGPNSDDQLQPNRNTLVNLDLVIRDLSEDQLKLVTQANWYYMGCSVVVPGPEINWITKTSPATEGIDVHGAKLEPVTYKSKIIMLSEALDDIRKEERAAQERKIRRRGKWNAILTLFLVILLLGMLYAGSDAPEGSAAAVVACVAKFLLLSALFVPLYLIMAFSLQERSIGKKSSAWPMLTPLAALVCAAKWTFEITWVAAIGYVSAMALGLVSVIILGRRLAKADWSW